MDSSVEMSRNFLKEVLARKRERLIEAKKQVPLEEIRKLAEASAPAEVRSLDKALRRFERINVIAEFKRASPSRGMIRASASADEMARAYEQAGAVGISVLTEEDHFRGSLSDLTIARHSVSVPVLRKDFIFDGYQVYESRAAGADAFLLIVAMLDLHRLLELMALGGSLGMASLVEVHDESELELACKAGASLIGVNNRNLTTFEVDLGVSRRLAPLAPKNATLVSESGLHERAQLMELREMGYDGFLIGEHLMRFEDPARALGALVDDGQD